MSVSRAFHLLYLRIRHRVRMHLVGVERRKARKFLSMPIPHAPRFDERSTIDRFRRENGLR